MTNRRELYRSPDGDAWYLGREPQTGEAFVLHQPNGFSGSHVSHVDLGAFLTQGGLSPERQSLLRLMGTLVDVPPYAGRT